MGFFSKILPQSPDAKADFSKTLGRAKSVNEFLGDVIDAVKDTDLPAAVVAAVPWAEPLGEALSEAVPPVRFVVKLFEGLGEVKDPGQLGYLACTLAYQQAVQQAVPEVLGRAQKTGKRLHSELREQTPATSYDFERFSFEDALQHDFVRDADEVLLRFVNELGASGSTFRKLQHQVQARFVPNLKILLSHGKTRERFGPFTELLTLGTDEARATDALLRHADHQRWLFEEQPVLGREPFACQHIYVDTDCGRLRWEEIQSGRRHREAGQKHGPLDPFDEKNGGRLPLLETALELIADPDFQDAIVIQGPAGCGKSSFTLRLCGALLQQGLQPIRIELKHLDTRASTAISEALPAAVELADPERDPDAERFSKDDLFLDGRIFDRDVRFRGTKICPYVLILDGWDEISLSASEGYQQQLERLLQDVRREFLERRSFPVRVILSGRPTDAVQGSGFLRKETVWLTLRPLSPDQLDGLLQGVGTALDERPLGGGSEWDLGKVEGIPGLLRHYRRDFEAAREKLSGPRANGSGLEVLGLPLLTLLALRLMADWPGEIAQLVENTTTLYRSLVDLVIGKGGKPEGSNFEPDGRATLAGDNLRVLLRDTAEAMTVLGEESLSRDELAVRLDLEGRDLDERVQSLGEDQVLSRLMISFFFKGGHSELGCEFSHKSFREYLFAEQIVETLKDYGRTAPQDLPERPFDQYWKDFDDTDPRFDWSRSLAETLGPAWITPEVGRHLSGLLRWEIARSAGADPYPRVGERTPRCSLEQWETVRDGLADLWDWWGAGIHLRPQPYRKPKSREIGYREPLALEVAREARPRARPYEIHPPPRQVTIDAHLGDALFRLVAEVHSEVATRRGWPGASGKGGAKAAWDGATPVGRGPRRFQTQVEQAGGAWTLFAPSGNDTEYFRTYVARINACGFRPRGEFPSCLKVRGVDLRQAQAYRLAFWASDLSGANLAAADLREADLRRVCLRWADLSQATLPGANLGRVILSDADLSNANLASVNLVAATLSGANLSGAILSNANLSSLDHFDRNPISNLHTPIFVLGNINLSNVDLSRANLSGADLTAVDFSNTNLSKTNLSNTNLSKVDLSKIDLSVARYVPSQYLKKPK